MSGEWLDMNEGTEPPSPIEEGESGVREPHTVVRLVVIPCPKKNKKRKKQ